MTDKKDIEVIKKTIYMKRYVEKLLRLVSAETGESQSSIMTRAFMDLYVKEISK